MVTLGVVETLGLTVLWSFRPDLVQVMVEGVQVGDVVLQAVPLILLPGLLAHNSSSLALATETRNSGVRTVRQVSLGTRALRSHQPSFIINLNHYANKEKRQNSPSFSLELQISLSSSDIQMNAL